MKELEASQERRTKAFEVILPRIPEIYRPLSPDQELNPTACQYFAAVFDTIIGLGIYIETCRIKKGGKVYQYEYAREKLSYHESEGRYPERALALKLLGGNVRIYPLPNKFTGVDDVYYKWHLGGRKAGDLVRSLSPFLLLKNGHGEFFDQLEYTDDVEVRKAIAEDYRAYTREYEPANIEIVKGTVLPKAYLAGLFDFKGSISIRDKDELIVVCTLPNEDLARCLQDEYQGNVGPHLPQDPDEEPDGGKLIERKPRWQWLVSGGRAASFLRDISPYLWLHKDRAESTLLEFEPNTTAS